MAQVISLDQERQSKDSRNMRCILASRQSFAVAMSPTTRVDVLETGDVPILFTLSQMKNLDTTIELDPKGDEFTCPAFWACTPVQQSTPQWDIVLDLTSLACQPKPRDRHLTFAPSEQKSAYPAHTRDLDEDEDDEPFNSVPNCSSVQKRLSIYNWNPGNRRGREGALEKQIAGTWHSPCRRRLIMWTTNSSQTGSMLHTTEVARCFSTKTPSTLMSKSSPFIVKTTPHKTIFAV